MSTFFRFTYFTSILTTTLFLGTQATADAVKNSMKESMAECVSSNSARIGSPLEDNDRWAEVVASAAAASYSMIKIFGTEAHGGFQEAMNARTRDTLIASLEDKGFKGFRSETIETVKYCMPFALVAAADEMKRQEKASCPDDTDYLETVENITASNSELRSRYGDNADSARELSLAMIKYDFWTSFPEIFSYGKDDYPAFEESGELKGVHEALNEIKLENASEIHALVNKAMDGLNGVRQESERLRRLKLELICIKDWLDIYPIHEISRLTSGD